MTDTYKNPAGSTINTVPGLRRRRHPKIGAGQNKGPKLRRLGQQPCLQCPPGPLPPHAAAGPTIPQSSGPPATANTLNNKDDHHERPPLRQNHHRHHRHHHADTACSTDHPGQQRPRPEPPDHRVRAAPTYRSTSPTRARTGRTSPSRSSSAKHPARTSRSATRPPISQQKPQNGTTTRQAAPSTSVRAPPSGPSRSRS